MPETMTGGFEKSAETYDDHAVVQKLSSDYLADICSKFIKNPKNILDIGCGTGFTTIALQEYYADAEYTLCDISEKMVKIARRKVSKGNYIICDAENYNFKNSYDLIVSNLALQWFKNFEFFLGSILLKCECLAFSILTRGSFLEYEQLFAEKGIKIFDTEYKSEDEIREVSKKYGEIISFSSKEYKLEFENAVSAAKHFKYIGANYVNPQYNQSKIAARLLARRASINLDYKIAFVVLKRGNK